MLISNNHWSIQNDSIFLCVYGESNHHSAHFGTNQNHGLEIDLTEQINDSDRIRLSTQTTNWEEFEAPAINPPFF